MCALTQKFCTQILIVLVSILLLTNSKIVEANFLRPSNEADIKQLIQQSQAQKTIPLLKRQSFLSKADIDMVRISPDGEYLSYIQRLRPSNRKRFTVWLYHIARNSHKKLFTFKSIRQLNWTGDSQALIIESEQGISHAKISQQATASITPELIARINKAKGESYYGTDDFKSENFYVKHVNKRANTKNVFELHRYNLLGKSKVIYQSHDNFESFLISPQGELILLKTSDGKVNGTGKSTLLSVNQKSKAAIWQCEYDDPCKPHFYDEKNKQLILTTNANSDTSQLVKIDLTSALVVVLAEDKQQKVDLNTVLFSYENTQLTPALASYYHNTLSYQALNKELTSHLQHVSKSFSGKTFKLRLAKSSSAIITPWLIEQQDSNQPQARFSLYHPKTKHFSEPFANAPAYKKGEPHALEEHQLPKKHAINYLASDGMNIQAYLTLPAGIAIKEAPMVTLVHGGPWSRDKASYDRRVQFLANRGYIVFQPNFRGSTGFGKHYTNSAKNKFGDGRVQQDITDGVLFLLKQGVGDKNRLAIAGHSFGGFSTLAGLSFTSELYQVGFAGAPPTDLSRSIAKFAVFEKSNRRTSSKAYFMKEQVVDWRNNTEVNKLRMKSPDQHVNKISKPLFIWAGVNDKRVFVEDVIDYASRVQAQGKPVSLLIDKKSGHSPKVGLPQEAYFYALEYTLAKFLEGDYEKLEDKQDNRLIKFLSKSIIINDMPLLL